MRRRFITKEDIDDLADAGTTAVELDDRVTVTDLARERARERGVRLVAGEAPAGGSPTTSGEGRAPGDLPATGRAPADLHAEVRAAVIARLGTAPDGLDAVITRVLSHR